MQRPGSIPPKHKVVAALRCAFIIAVLGIRTADVAKCGVAEDVPSVAAVMELAGAAIKDLPSDPVGDLPASGEAPLQLLAVAQAEPRPPSKPPTKAPATPKKKRGKVETKDEALPEFDGAPEDVCAVCLGAGHVPLGAGRRPYLHAEGDAAPEAELSVPWRWCPKCRADHTVNELIEAESLRFRTALDSHAAWEARTGLRLIRGETRHLVIHGECTVESMREQLKAAENLAAMLQLRTKSVFLTPTRPGTLEILSVNDRSKYMKLIETCRSVDEFKSIPDWWLLPHVTGFSGHVTTVNYVPLGNPAPPANVVISAMAVRQMNVVTE